MSRRGRLPGWCRWTACAVAPLALLVAAPAPAATIKVKSNADEFNVAGNCTLREAVQAANTDANFGGCARKHASGGTADTIVVQAETEYPITIAGGNDDANTTGDFDIASRITIKVDGPGRATIDANEMDRAIDVQQGGNLRASKLQIANGTPPNNGFSYGGGAILNHGRLSLSRSELTLNDAVQGQAVNGGAVHAVGKKTVLNRVDINHNTSDGFAGGIAFDRGLLRVVHSVVDQNTTDGPGGGIGVSGSFDDVRMLLKATTISGNTSFQDGPNAGGGGVMVSYFGEGTLKATNVTIFGNTSYGSGGGIYSYTGQMTLNGATVTSNLANFDGDADGKGGGAAGSGLSFLNSIIADNEDASAASAQQDCQLISSVGHNLVSQGGGCPETGSNRVAVARSWGDLEDNGGPTPTCKLDKASDAIGHAGKDAPKNDQRGVKRDADPDIGAYER